MARLCPSFCVLMPVAAITLTLSSLQWLYSCCGQMHRQKLVCGAALRALLVRSRPDSGLMRFRNLLHHAGKSKLNDSVLSVAYSVQQASQLQNLEKHENQVVTLKFRPVYMSSVTLSGAAPNIVFPQRTGDLLSIRLPIAGPILPAQRAVRAALIQQKKDVQILQAANPLPAIPLKVQRLYRHHDALVVYAAPYGPGGAFLSIDLTGRIVLWPPSYDTENALGWTQPMQVFCLAKVMKVPQLGKQWENDQLPKYQGAKSAVPIRCKDSAAEQHRCGSVFRRTP